MSVVSSEFRVKWVVFILVRVVVMGVKLGVLYKIEFDIWNDEVFEEFKLLVEM